jgi:uncharacterized protein YbbK (DUF523 family)
MPQIVPRIGVSSCLLGEPVRFNGGHSRDRFLTDVLAPYVEWVPVCPEMEIGLGAPRETLRLMAGQRLVSRSGADHTAAIEALADARRDDLAGLSGYVLKSRSPSCGLRSARVNDGELRAAGNGTGVFAASVLAADPQLPAEEEGRLHDMPLREAFVERVFGRARVTGLFAGSWRQRDLVDFHSRRKLQLLAHDPVRYRQAGRLVATARALPSDTVSMRYAGLLASALARPVSRGRHAAGCARYLAAQTYLDPFPAGLGLRNHA